ncbi:MAG: UPF0280 family protein [Dehalococcoidales bacterium]|nr:UPF0280 family protein [Dehalococcoidales bacterium]
MAKSSAYQPRTYRHWTKGSDLVSYSITVKETDLYIRTVTNLKSKAERLILKYREPLEKYISSHPEFSTSLEPVTAAKDAPRIVKVMAAAAAKVGVGPMASVAGAIAEFVGKELLEYSPEIIIENGGDIYIKSLKKRTVGIYAGDSPLTGKIGIEIDGKDNPIGVCTSSGKVGHSLSFGKADAVTILAKSATLADAAATATGNIVQTSDDITRAIESAQKIDGLLGVLIIVGDKMGIWGQIKICSL